MYNKKKIEEQDVINVFGMMTKEHYSPKTVEKVAKSLEKGGHSVKVIEGGMTFIDEMKDFMPKVVAGERPGMVFNMAYGIQGRNRYTHVPAMLEMLDANVGRLLDELVATIPPPEGDAMAVRFPYAMAIMAGTGVALLWLMK